MPDPEAEVGDEVLIGVEEEFLLLDSTTGHPAPRINQVIERADQLAGDQAQEELHRAQIELATVPCATLGALRTDLLDLRQKLVAAAQAHGCSVVAAATYPDAMGEAGRLITRNNRYQDMEQANPMLVREQLICGCHIHVSAPDPGRAVHAMNGIRRWLPILLALSVNSPFWEGIDTGFASYRSEVWARWPTAGPIGEFASMKEYDELVERLIAAGVMLDDGMAYWDVRPSRRFPTLELRIADVMPDIGTVIAVAALARALVGVCSDQDLPSPTLRPELLRAATWKSATSGIVGALIDPVDGRARPAREAVDELLALTASELDGRGELQTVTSAVDSIFEQGTGASVQRAAYSRRQRLSDVIEACTLGVDGWPRCWPQ